MNMYVRMCTYTYVYAAILFAAKSSSTPIRRYECFYVCIYVRMYVCTCVYIYMRV